MLSGGTPSSLRRLTIRSLMRRSSSGFAAIGVGRDLSTSGGRSSVDGPDLARDVGGFVGGEEAHDGRDLLGASGAVHRNAREDFAPRGLAQVGDHLRLD